MKEEQVLFEEVMNKRTLDFNLIYTDEERCKNEVVYLGGNAHSKAYPIETDYHGIEFR